MPVKFTLSFLQYEKAFIDIITKLLCGGTLLHERYTTFGGGALSALVEICRQRRHCARLRRGIAERQRRWRWKSQLSFLVDSDRKRRKIYGVIPCGDVQAGGNFKQRWRQEKGWKTFFGTYEMRVLFRRERIHCARICFRRPLALSMRLRRPDYPVALWHVCLLQKLHSKRIRPRRYTGKIHASMQRTGKE